MGDIGLGQLVDTLRLFAGRLGGGKTGNHGLKNARRCWNSKKGSRKLGGLGGTKSGLKVASQQGRRSRRAAQNHETLPWRGEVQGIEDAFEDAQPLNRVEAQRQERKTHGEAVEERRFAEPGECASAGLMRALAYANKHSSFLRHAEECDKPIALLLTLFMYLVGMVETPVLQGWKNRRTVTWDATEGSSRRWW